jgi:hypothetical protein
MPGHTGRLKTRVGARHSQSSPDLLLDRRCQALVIVVLDVDRPEFVHIAKLVGLGSKEAQTHRTPPPQRAPGPVIDPFPLQLEDH